MWIVPVSCYAVLCKPLIWLVDEAVLTITMKSGDADAGHGPGRDRERNRFPSLISNVEGGVLGTILRD